MIFPKFIIIYGERMQHDDETKRISRGDGPDEGRNISGINCCALEYERTIDQNGILEPGGDCWGKELFCGASDLGLY